MEMKLTFPNGKATLSPSLPSPFDDDRTGRCRGRPRWPAGARNDTAHRRLRPHTVTSVDDAQPMYGYAGAAARITTSPTSTSR